MIRYNTSFKIKEKAFACNRLFLFVPVCMLLLSCDNNHEKEKAAPATDSSTVYYPINNFIRQQIQDVDTTPYFLYRLIVTGKTKDSTIIARPVFDKEIRQFLLPQLEEKALRKNFTESVYDDEGTGNITITYTPVDKDNLVQSASVLLDRQNQQVNWIFINTYSSNNDSTLIQRIGWKANKSCYINQDISYPNKGELQKQISFVWNDKPED